jgi:AraC-like DNA-binding protein
MGETGQPNRFAISYRGPAQGQRYEMWREEICRSFCRLDAGPTEDSYVDCRNDFALVHSVALATPTGSSARFARTRALLADGCDDFVLISASRGPVRVTQGAKIIDLSAAQMCLTEMNVVGDAILNSAGRFTTTRIPRRALLQVSPTAEARLAQPLWDNPALIVMIERYFALCYDVALDLDAVGQQTAAQHLIDLVGLLLGGDADRREAMVRRGYSSARLDLLKADTLQSLSRSDLTVDAIAHANGLSARQAQRLFARSGATFTEFVLEHRLSLARRLLSDRRNRHRKVSDIADAAGFADLSYFNRAFRRRFGVTPRDMRAEPAQIQHTA